MNHREIEGMGKRLRRRAWRERKLMIEEDKRLWRKMERIRRRRRRQEEKDREKLRR